MCCLAHPLLVGRRVVHLLPQVRFGAGHVLERRARQVRHAVAGRPADRVLVRPEDLGPGLLEERDPELAASGP